MILPNKSGETVIAAVAFEGLREPENIGDDKITAEIPLLKRKIADRGSRRRKKA